MKLCIVVGLGKVKVGLVLRVMKTLLELMLVEPTWDKAGRAGVGGVEGVEGSLGVEGVVGVGTGAVDLQVEGCPLHA